MSRGPSGRRVPRVIKYVSLPATHPTSASALNRNDQDDTPPRRRTRSREPKATGKPKVTSPFPNTPELREERAAQPVAQAMIKATRDLLAADGAQWTTTERIHDMTRHPTRGTPVNRTTMRYYFGNRERLFLQVARYEHVRQLGRVARALRALRSESELAPVLVRLAKDDEHYRVTLALLDAMQTMPELADLQRELWANWRQRMVGLVGELQERGIVREELDPGALSLLWVAVALGLAVHRYAEPDLEIDPVLALAERYAASLGRSS